MKIAALFGRTGAAKKQPGLSTELKENTMASVLDLVTPVRAKKQPDAGTVHWFDDCVRRSKAGRVYEETLLTPGLANVILNSNPANRRIRENLISHYASDMAAGRWENNGEPIIISNDGRINDGQHRCLAVIDANVTIPMLFVFGPSYESRLTTDQGGTKTTSDYLSMEGIKNSANAAAIAPILMSLETSEFKNTKNRFLTKTQIRARVHSDPRIGEAAHYSATVQKFTRGTLPPALIGTAYYLFCEIDEDDARDFLDQVCIGENIKRGDPAFAVRAALTNLTSLNRSERLEVVFRGWVAFRQNRSLSIAKVNGYLPALV